MPRRDRTYTAMDIVRFWQNNLDPREQELVLCYFCTLCDNQTGEELSLDAVQDLILVALSLIPVVGRIVRIGALAIEFVQQGLEIIDTLETAAGCIEATRGNPELQDLIRLLEGP